MKKWILMASMMLAAGSLTACSDDDGGDNGNNNPDVTDDGGSDMTDGGTDDSTDGDTEDDADVQVGPTCFGAGEGVGVGVERDGESNDGDLFCDDEEETALGAECVEEGVVDCDNDGINDDAEFFFRTDEVGGTGFATNPKDDDTDGNGATDSEDIAAGNDPTTLLDDVNADDLTPASTVPAYSYVSGIGIEGSDCCFANLDSDAKIDNDLAALLDSLGGLSGLIGDDIDLTPEGITELIAPVITDGTLTLLLEHTNVPEDVEGGVRNDVEIRAFLGDLVPVDGDGNTDVDNGTVADISTRIEGNGEYFLGEAVGDTPISAILNEGGVLVSDGTLQLNLDLTELAADLLGGAELVLDLAVDKLQIRGDVAESTEAGITDQIGVESDGSLQLGGGVNIVKIAELLNSVLGECYPGDFELLSIDAVSNDNRVKLACASDIPSVDNPDGLGGLCGDVGDLLGSVCPLLDSIIGSNLSVDTDDDGKADGLAVGLTLDLAGAADIRDEPVDEQPVVVAE